MPPRSVGGDRQECLKRTYFLALLFAFAGFWVKADAAAALASFEALGSWITLAATEAAFLLVTFLFPTCVSAEAAAVFSALLAVLLFRVLAAADAAFFDVLSLAFVAMVFTP